MNLKGDLHKELLDRVSKKDAQAILLLYKMYFDDLFQFVYQGTRSEYESLLILSQSFNALFKIKGNMSSLGDIYLFLRKYCMRETMDYIMAFLPVPPRSKSVKGVAIKNIEMGFSTIGIKLDNYKDIGTALKNEEEKDLQIILDKYCSEATSATFQTFDQRLAAAIRLLPIPDRQLLHSIFNGGYNPGHIIQKTTDQQQYLKIRKQILQSIIEIYPCSIWGFFLFVSRNKDKF